MFIIYRAMEEPACFIAKNEFKSRFAQNGRDYVNRMIPKLAHVDSIKPFFLLSFGKGLGGGGGGGWVRLLA